MPDPAALVPFAEASRPAAEVPLASYRGAAANRLVPLCWPEGTPSFQIDATRPVFAIGSCFARNIEKSLIAAGCEVPLFHFAMSADEWGGEIHQIVNKYTPATIHNEISWCHGILMRGDGFQPSDADPMLYDIGDGMVVDGGLTGFRPISRERAILRREAVFDYFSRAFEADVVIITLGYIESWWDSARQRFIEQVPMNRQLLRTNREDFHFCRLSYEQSKQLLEQSLALLNSIGGPKKILITTSPVPLASTFTRDDVIVANSYSKSLLRTVSGALVAERDDMDYFPSYETVTLSKDWSVYAWDKRHVSDALIAQIMDRVIARYFINLPEAGQKMLQSVAKRHAGDLAEAARLATEVAALTPAVAEVWAHLARCHADMKDWPVAVAAMGRALALVPGHAGYLTQYVGACIENRQYAEALAAAEAYHAHTPKSPAAERALARGLCYAGNTGAAFDIINRMLEANPVDELAALILSEIHEQRGDLDAALDAARKAQAIKWDHTYYAERVAELEARQAARVETQGVFARVRGMLGLGQKKHAD